MEHLRTDGDVVLSREAVEGARALMLRDHADGIVGSEVALAFSARIESLVVGEFKRALAAHRVEDAALLALGGFGRRELAPYSDVDLLLVVPDETPREAAEKLARSFFTPLWDAGLEPGHALRSPDEALALALEDHTIATALLDGRVIAGSVTVGQWPLAKFVDALAGERLERFVEAKVGEMAQRRKRHLESIFLLEPNIKNGVGGLRDLACGLWVVRATHGGRGFESIGHQGLLPKRELDALRLAHDRLLRFRTGLHFIAGRRDDRLTFAHQERLAKELGYRNETDTLAVELLMRDYYLAAQTIEHATNALLERTTGTPGARGGENPEPLTPALELLDGQVAFRPEARPAERPELLVELFVQGERRNRPVLAGARDLVALQAAEGEPGGKGWAPAVDALLDYLESPGANGRALDGMFETGVLGLLVPPFRRLRARVQHDVYHVYTVDTHTLFAVKKLLRLRAGRLAAEHPGFTRLVQDLPRPLALLVGLLFHDLGKGLGGDHSMLGEGLVREWGTRAGLSPDVVEDAAFLVREHLRLPQVAFRRDLSDPALIDRVAELVQTRERLDMLYLLTWADIASVGPETWNDWRAGLLAELYRAVRARLDEQRGRGNLARERTASARAGARELVRHLGESELLRDFIEVVPERYLATVPARRAATHFALWASTGTDGVQGGLVPRPDVTDAGEVAVIAPDKPGLLAAIAGTFAAHGIDILGAEIFSLARGRVLDTFKGREPGGHAPSEERVRLAMADLVDVLGGRQCVRALLSRRRGEGALWAPGPHVAPRVLFDLPAARDATVVDVVAQDRIGLLHDIARALHEANASVVLARIATEGNRATDAFYLQDEDGRKITAPERLELIRKKLLQAVAGAAGEAEVFL